MHSYQRCFSPSIRLSAATAFRFKPVGWSPSAIHTTTRIHSEIDPTTTATASPPAAATAATAVHTNKGSFGNVTAATKQIVTWVKAKRLDKAYKLLQEIKNSGISPPLEAYTAVVSAASTPKLIAVADTIYDQLYDEGVAMDRVFFETYMCSLVNAGKFRPAHQIYFRMYKRLKIPPADVTFRNLITIYGESKRFDLVKKTLKTMAKRGFAVHNEHYRLVVLALAKSKGLDDAFTMVANMETDRTLYPNPPSEDVYNALIKACCMHRYTVERSWSVLSKMKKAGVKPSSRSYTPILQAFTTFRRAKQISVVLDDMDKEGVPKDGYIYSRILHALVNSFNLKKAFEIFQEYKATGLPPRRDLYDKLLMGLSFQAQRGEEQAKQAVAQAKALLEEMKQADVDMGENTFCNLIRLHHAAKDHPKVAQLYQEFKSLGFPPTKSLVKLMDSISSQKLASLEAAGHF